MFARCSLVATLSLACAPYAPPPEQPTPAVTASPRRELGSAQALIQGRLAIGPRGEAPSSYLDIEVDGAGGDALRACDALLAREKERVAHGSAALEVNMARACSDDALVPPDAQLPFALMQSEELDELALALELGSPVEKGAKRPLRVRRTLLSGFPSQEACTAALERIEQASQEAQATAEASATTWLSEKLEEQRRLEAESCNASPSSAVCERDRALTKLLEQKLADRPHEEARTSSSAASCFRR